MRHADPAKRAAILCAAAAELKERRAGALTIEAVARRARIAKGTVYRYFPSADALYEAVRVDQTSTLQAGAAESEVDPLDP